MALFSFFNNLFHHNPTPIAEEPVAPVFLPDEITNPAELLRTLDFENIPGTDNSSDYISNLPAGWFTDNPSGVIEIGNQERYGIEGNDGNKVIEIEAKHGDGNLYTMINSQAGVPVSISYDAARRSGVVSSAIEVLVDGVQVGLIQPADKAFVTESITVPGTGDEMRVEFKSLNTNGIGIILDNINIVQPLGNNDPVANDDFLTTTESGAVVIAGAELLANDFDPDGDDIFTFTVDSAVNGTVGYNQLTDEVTFTPDAGYTGPASFSYTIVDDKYGSDSATVNLVVESTVNQAPVATDDMLAATAANSAIVIAPGTLLANDFDPEGGEVFGKSLGDAVNGSVYFDGTNVVFTPDADYVGPASFTYTIADAEGVESTATVNLTIEAGVIVPPTNNTVLMGTDGDDVIQGTDLDETIFSGAGNDIMIGGNGSDTFAWDLSDITAGTDASTDTVVADFSDRLDLSDLLINEQQLDAGESAAEALEDYLDFSVNANGDTVIEVSAFGQHDNGVTVTDHIIEIAGYDATAGNTLSDVQVISNLMNSGHLITDLG